MSGSTPSWMNSAQAHYLREEYAEAEAHKLSAHDWMGQDDAD